MKTNQTKKDDFLSVRGIPKELKHRFRVAVAKEGSSVKQVVKELMESYVETIDAQCKK